LFPFLLSLIFSILFTSCNSSQTTEDNPFSNPPSSQEEQITNSQNYFIPKPLTSFSIVLGDELPENFTAEVIDLDAFNTTKEEIETLHKAGKKVFAYISVGSWEPYRNDSQDFPHEIIGNIYPGWEDEKFLNIKAIEKLSPIIQQRFDMIQSKGFDGIEPDNIDIYTVDMDQNDGTGFHITLEDTKKYVDFLIKEAHKRNLSIGQKNAPELTEQYGDLFDWALLEDPFYEEYADTFTLYPSHNKAVFALSYLDNTSKEIFLQSICSQAQKLYFTAILKERNLSKFETKCPQ
jgi:endo-alpha-1,4-polygalactosaminidase (GH114 family)